VVVVVAAVEEVVVVAVAALCEVSNSFQSVVGPDEVLDPFGSFAVVDSCKPDDYSASDNSSYSVVVVVADVDAESVVVVAAAGEGVVVVVVAGPPSRNSTVETVSSTWEKRVVGAWALTSQPSLPCIVVVVVAVEVACCNCSDN
jgi:hypothetical protein